MTIMMEIINSINKILSYLDISPKYLNRGYTIVSIFPTMYIIRILVGLYKNENYLQVLLYGIIFLILVYFILLNLVYYFFDKNLKIDITQLFVKYLPEEVFNFEDSAIGKSKKDMVDFESVKIDYVEGYELILLKNVAELIENDSIKTNKLGYEIPQNILYPYYVTIKKDTNIEIHIGTTYAEMEKIGTIEKMNKEILGLFLSGGKVIEKEREYNRPLQLDLRVKKNNIVDTIDK